MTELSRCPWPGKDAQYIAYHDEEWGVPEHDERKLFEKLCLEGHEAGLSWILILRKRENYRAAFEGFDPERVARFDAARVAVLLENPGIVRSRAKIEATIGNAQAYLRMREQGSTLNDLCWGAVGGRMKLNQFTSLSELPAETPESLALSKALKARGFKFVGGRTVYAFMQSMGMVNDHLTGCFRHAECAALGRT